MKSNHLTLHKTYHIIFTILCTIFFLILIAYGIVKASADDKLLPIYCVDRSADSGAPKVSLSFDAAWGDGR